MRALSAACVSPSVYVIMDVTYIKAGVIPVFAVTDEARRYINRKGSHIRVYLDSILVCNRSCQAPQGIRRQPAVQLGRPQPGEQEFYTQIELDDITIWYETSSIIPRDPAKPILISLKKTLFVYELQLEGVKPQGTAV